VAEDVQLGSQCRQRGCERGAASAVFGNCQVEDVAWRAVG
jgi:hypothetical protein